MLETFRQVNEADIQCADSKSLTGGEEVESIEDMFVEYHKILHENELKQPEDAVLGCAGLIHQPL